jgi:hypothetical protein
MRSKWLLASCLLLACGGGVSLGNFGTDGGSAGDDGGSSGTSSGGSGTGVKECASKDSCGPAPGAPTIKCDDGTVGGFTGRCIESPKGCEWEFRDCPTKPVCFDASGTFEPQYRKCAADNECMMIEYAQDCCGTRRVAGVATSAITDAKTCAAERDATLPKCGCPTGPRVADDGSTEGPSPSPGTGLPQVYCNTAKSVCETSFKGEVCGAETCKPTQSCCSGPPTPKPFCTDGACPVSRRVYKKDISYLTEADRVELAEEVLRFPLATYRYKSEASSDATHLGFIIDDVTPSPAVLPSGDRVDLYGYTTMTVAALQVQAKELADLRREVADLKRTCSKR